MGATLKYAHLRTVPISPAIVSLRLGGEAYQLIDDTNLLNSESDLSLENQVYTRLNI